MIPAALHSHCSCLSPRRAPERLNQSNRILPNKLSDTVITRPSPIRSAGDSGWCPLDPPYLLHSGRPYPNPAVPEKTETWQRSKSTSRKALGILNWIGSHRRTVRGRVRRSRPDHGTWTHATNCLLLQIFMRGRARLGLGRLAPCARCPPSRAVPFAAGQKRE